MSKNPTEKDLACHLPDCSDQHRPPGLYLVATPIGNLGDITVRALEVLVAADVVVCEDTRVTGKLLQAYGMKKSLLVYNDHSGEKERAKILKCIADGQIVALVSDAGMPLVSDPGYKLVQDCLAQGVYVTSLPGANAVLAGLQLSGLPSDQFAFLGFLPSKKAARQNLLQEWSDVRATLIAFESAARVVKALSDIAAVFGDREIVVARELTKLHEDVQRGSAEKLVAYYEANPPKGEVVVLIEGFDGIADEETVKRELQKALESMKVKDAARFVSEKLDVSSKDLYAMALEMKDE